MQEEKNPLETLGEIRSLMESSARFISLSGLSGVFAGIFALAGAGAVYLYFDFPVRNVSSYVQENTQRLLNRFNFLDGGLDYLTFLAADAAIVLILSLSVGIFFTTRKAKRQGAKIWNSLTKRLLISLMIPLVAGGIFCFALMWHGLTILIAPATLVFYGIALLNASKYTLHDIQYLGISEIILGLLACFIVGHNLFFWAMGFGILHIIYGILMYYKYEKS